MFYIFHHISIIKKIILIKNIAFNYTNSKKKNYPLQQHIIQ